MSEKPEETTDDESIPDAVVPAEAKANESSADKMKRRAAEREKRETLMHLVWLAAAFFLPLLFVGLSARDDDSSITIYHALRLGVTSFFIALAVLGLGQIDQKFGRSNYDLRSQILVSLLGMMLWLVWVGSGQMVFKAVDESKAGANAFDGR